MTKIVEFALEEIVTTLSMIIQCQGTWFSTSLKQISFPTLIMLLYQSSFVKKNTKKKTPYILSCSSYLQDVGDSATYWAWYCNAWLKYITLSYFLFPQAIIILMSHSGLLSGPPLNSSNTFLIHFLQTTVCWKGHEMFHKRCFEHMGELMGHVKQTHQIMVNIVSHQKMPKRVNSFMSWCTKCVLLKANIVRNITFFGCRFCSFLLLLEEINDWNYKHNSKCVLRYLQAVTHFLKCVKCLRASRFQFLIVLCKPRQTWALISFAFQVSTTDRDKPIKCSVIRFQLSNHVLMLRRNVKHEVSKVMTITWLKSQDESLILKLY